MVFLGRGFATLQTVQTEVVYKQSSRKAQATRLGCGGDPAGQNSGCGGDPAGQNSELAWLGYKATRLGCGGDPAGQNSELAWLGNKVRLRR
ncbi:hypothetical protein ACROYT_G003496 [Oculina patagonica]